MNIEATAVIEVTKPREELFAFATNTENLVRFFAGNPPLIPRIQKVSMQGHAELKKGVVRRVVLADGTPLDEEVTEWEPPRVFRYRVKGYRGLARMLFSHADASFIFSPLGGGTRISWRYSYELQSAAALPMAALVVKGPMQKAMQETLETIKRLSESGA